MKQCEECGKELGTFLIGSRCRECVLKGKIVLYDLITQVMRSKSIDERTFEILKQQSKETLLSLYFKIYEEFISDRELTEEEIKLLKRFQDGTGLSNEEIQYDDLIKPYLYVCAIKRDGQLPSVRLNVQGCSPVVLKEGEEVHFADLATLKERRRRGDKDSEYSTGVHFVLDKSVCYRLGKHWGYFLNDSEFKEASKGVLVITNQRLYLHPLLGQKPINIPIRRILTYHCYENGIEVYKESREKGYFFALDKRGSVEIFGICLQHLLSIIGRVL